MGNNLPNNGGSGKTVWQSLRNILRAPENRISQNNGLPASMNQGNNVVQNINQNSVPNNVAQQIVQQSNNNSVNVGDGLPSVPNQNNGSSSSTMSQWFISHMKGEGDLLPWGAVDIDGSEHSPPVSEYGWFTQIPSEHQQMSWSNHLARIREDVPDYGRHNHPDFDGDWVRWPRNSQGQAVANENGAYYRPTSLNNWR